MLEVRLKGRKPTAFTYRAETLEKATKGPASKMKSSLESTVGPLSDRT